MAQHDEEESLGFPYDVFLSFRGEDTREKFIGHLRSALSRKGIITFIDDKNLEMGESISPALSKAIEQSRVFIIVFSENYASSRWCLDELVLILQRSKNGHKKQRVFPIFYHVDPSDIMNQSNRYGEHMIAHQNKLGKDSQRVKNWRSALTEVSGFPGDHFTTGSLKSEIILIEELVDKVYKNIAPKHLNTGQNPVGLEPRIEEVKSLLEMKPGDKTVCMLGIYGLGGIGKTELAKALYDKIVGDFDAACFLADVREKSNKINGLEDLQKTLLSEMLEELETELGSTSKGMYQIKRKLHQKKVLLVLDDVDDKDRLEKLAGGCDWFGSGSRIIITTRDKDVLIAHKVEKIYEMKELDEQHSLTLFCRNAFKLSHPKIGFDNVSLRAVGFAKCLPLALKVIGSDLANLHEESLVAWEDALEEYKRNPPSKRILDMLKINYDRLGDNAKRVFLDIACFFKGERVEYVKKILEEFGASNINVLVNKSLLTIENGCLMMHDLIQDMGREIVRQETSKLGKRSRLWHYEDVIEVLTEDNGSDNIQGIMLDPPQQEVVNWTGIAFEEMKWLRILIIRNTLFSCEPKHLPNHLRVLEWEEYPSESFPSKFHPKKIIIFNLPRSHLTLEEPFKEILEFPFIQKVDARHTSLTTYTSDMLWFQAAKGMRELEIVMPQTEIPEWFDFIGNGENPRFWVRCKFPTFALALVFQDVTGSGKQGRHQVLQLQLVINGQRVSRKNHKFKIAPDHVLICDLRLLFSDEEWLSLDAFLEHEWNVVQVSYEASPSLTLSRWGVYVYEEGANMEHVQFICPDPKYLDMPPKVVPTEEDQDPKKVVENFRTDKVFESTKLENMDSLIKEEGKDELESEGSDSDSEDIDSFLMTIFLQEYYASAPSVLEDKNDVQQQKEKRRKIFSDGVRDGLVEAQKNCPSINVVKTRSVALIKGTKVRWISEELPEVVKLYIGGVISGLLEAKLRFPNLDVSETISPLLHKVGMKGLLVDRFGQPRLHLIQHLNMDYGQQPLTRYIYHDGIMDGLYEAQNSFPSLDIIETKNVALDKMASWSKSVLGEDVVQVLPTVETRIYSDGIVGGLVEAKKSFPDLSIIDIVTAVLCRAGIIEAYFVDDETESFHYQNLALKRVKDRGKGPMNVGEASTSGHEGSEEEQGSNPQQEEIMREIFYEGITDALVHARNKFPSLDIDKTRSAAFNKKIYGHRALWSFTQLKDGLYPRNPPPSLELKTYMEGIVNGLLEAKLTFPDLDIWATLDTLDSQRFKASIVSLPSVPELDWTNVIPPPPLQTSTTMKQQSSKSDGESKLKEEHEALRKEFVQLESEDTALNKDSDAANDELIQKLNSQADEFVSKKVDCTSGTRMHSDNGCKCGRKYEKVSTVLKGKVEELGRLYDIEIESYQNSEEFQDLMKAVYLNGQKDGIVEAQTLLFAQDMDTKTPLFKENEEHVIDEVVDDEILNVAGVPSPTSPDAVNDNPHPESYNLSGLEESFNWFEFV